MYIYEPAIKPRTFCTISNSETPKFWTGNEKVYGFCMFNQQYTSPLIAINEHKLQVLANSTWL